MPVPENTSNQDRYRVRTQADEVAMLWNHGGESIPTEILGLSMDGVEFLAERELASNVQLGDTCLQVFFDLVSDLRVEVVGVVRELQVQGDLYRVEMAFVDQESLAEQLADLPTWRYFNRRRHFRVRPRGGQYQAVKVDLEWPRYRGEHLLHDVSAQGLSIRLAKHDSLEIPKERPIRARLQLPKEGEFLDLVLRKAHENRTPTHRRIGFLIDQARTAYFEAIEERIVSAVMDWQRSALQAKAHSMGRTETHGPNRRMA